MIQKRFGEIQKSDIDSLFEEEVRESRTLDYKQELPGKADGDKKEFLADVSSFANAGGGDILFGVSERKEDGKNTGVPDDAVVGIPGFNADAETLRLESILLTGIDPRIPGVQMKEIAGFSSGSVFLLRVPRSWSAPHMVVYQSASRFYSRTSAGKYQLDVQELRSAFAMSESLSEQIKRFRDERLGRLVADDAPVRMMPCAKAILHLVPLASFQTGGAVDLSNLIKGQQVFFSAPNANSFSFNHRFNFEGFLQWEASRSSNGSRAYVQFFRNGSVELVEALCHYENNSIPSNYVQNTFKAVQRFFTAYRNDFGIEPPVVALLSFTSIKGYELMPPGNTSPRGNGAPVDRDVLMLPDILFESYEADLTTVLRPAFDALWQACGYADSANAT